MKRTNLHAKNTPLKLSEQVQNILTEKGFSFLFNWNDYNHFKKQVATAWNKANAIAELFLEECGNQNSDFSQYIF